MAMEAGDVGALAGLFGAAFLAATLVPAQSEALLAAMVLSAAAALPVLLIVAAAGNILGSCLNWWLGWQVDRFRHRRWFPVSEDALAKARATYARWGWPSLALSWVPIIGDPLTLAAGVMKEPFWRFVLIVGVAKTLRYVMVMALAGQFVA
jgi:membrane protein YqaA with SNARE-associated domain